VLGNIVSSLDHIPGTMLLNGVARMFAEANPGDAGVAATLRAAFACGDIRVLPAYPLSKEHAGGRCRSCSRRKRTTQAARA
jgi:hypothetical protein